MAAENPYQPPASEGYESDLEQFPMVRLFWSGTLVLLACAFALLMNGQVFTNGLFILGLFLASGAAWVPLASSTTSRYRRLTRWLVGLHLVVVVCTAATLAADYRSQKRFNEQMERLRVNSASD